ncbi:MAG: hypothetical protein WAX69_13160 [Victivallales bacterium]
MSLEIIREKCAAQIDGKYGLRNLNPDFADTLRRIVEEQIGYETDQIRKHGLGEEFIAMADMTGFARDSGCMLHPGGWGTSSIVAYLLGITDIEPMSYGLVFNAEAIKKSRLYLAVPSHQKDKIRKLMLILCASQERLQFIPGKTLLEDRNLLLSIARALDLDRYYDDIAEYMDVCDLPMTVTDICARNNKIQSFLETEFLGTKLEDIILHLQGIFEGENITDFDFKVGPRGIRCPLLEIEDYKILKVDIYGFKELDALSLTVDEIVKDDPGFDIRSVPLDDSVTFDLIGGSDVDGIPYLQCQQGRQLCRLIRPKNIEEHLALITFIRNPLSSELIQAYVSNKSAPENIPYAHPEIGMILGETYGIMLYREQAINIIKVMAGVDYGEALGIYGDVQKKINMDTHKQNFVKESHLRSRIDKESAMALWSLIESCPDTSKAYDVQKAILTYRMAYIKATH